MLKTFLAGAAGTALVLLTGAPVGAADVFTNGNGSLKDTGPIVQPDTVVNWTGFYVGVQGGYGNANHNLSVQEYFKNYCASEGDTSVGFDEDGNIDWNAWKTVENKKEAWPTITGETCETLEKPGRGGFAAGSHFTVPGDSREIGSIDGVNSHGAIGGGRIGFDWARGRLLFGLFGEYNVTNMETNVSIAGVGNFGLEKDDEWSVGGRVGYIVAPRTLAYVLAAFTQTEYNVTGLGAVDFGDASVQSGATFNGLSVGAGIEFALAANIFLGMEYTHTFYGEETILDIYDAGANNGVKVLDDLDEDKIMATLKIKFNGSPFGN